jgi:hypothetical protein
MHTACDDAGGRLALGSMMPESGLGGTHLESLPARGCRQSMFIALALGRVRARQVETLPPAKHARTIQPGER